MCEPSLMIGGAMMAMSMATTAYSIKEQSDQANKQAKLAKDQAAAMERNAKQARAIDMQTANQRAKEIETKGSSASFERIRQAARETAKIRLSSAEAGVFGTSVFRQLVSADVQAGHDLGLIGADTKNELLQNEQVKKGIQADYKSRMDDAKMTKQTSSLYSGPSGMGSMLQLGSAGADGFMSGYTMGSGFNSATTPVGNPTAKPAGMSPTTFHSMRR